MFKTPKFVYEIEHWIFMLGTPISVYEALKLVFLEPTLVLIAFMKLTPGLHVSFAVRRLDQALMI